MEQLNLFRPSLNVTPRIKAAMRESIRACGQSREEIVDRMKALAKADGLGGGRGSIISLPNLDAWCSETKSNLIPLQLLPIFCFAVSDMSPLRAMAAPLGADIIDSKEAQLLKWAQIEVQSRALAKKRKRILSEIGEIIDGRE